METGEAALKWLEQLDDEKRPRAIDECFAKVASTQEGKIVFAVLLEQMYFFRRAETPEQQALNNFAKHLVKDHFGEHAQIRTIEALLSRSD